MTQNKMMNMCKSLFCPTFSFCPCMSEIWCTNHFQEVLSTVNSMREQDLLIFALHVYSGAIDDRSKPLIFTMARLDKVKNITGLVELYGKNDRLRELANLVVVGGYVDVKNSKDREEMREIEKMHDLMKKYNLHGQLRWISAQTNRARNGELYRYIADTRGVFVQVGDHKIHFFFQPHFFEQY